MQLEKIERNVAWIRLISVIAVVASGFGSLLMFVIGAVKVIKAYATYLGPGPPTQTVPNEPANVAIALVVQAIDAFLIALVLLIFANGVYNLFVNEVDVDKPKSKGWSTISSVPQLKSTLAELVIIILMVKFLESALRSFGGYSWEMLILPLGVLMLAASVRVLNLK